MNWSLTAKVGDTIVYHRGDTVVDTKVGASARIAHKHGLVFLAQKRLGSDHYAYTAIRISEKAAKVLGLGKNPGLMPPLPDMIDARRRRLEGRLAA